MWVAFQYSDYTTKKKVLRNDGEIYTLSPYKDKNDENGAARSVNLFPYVNGNFLKAGAFVKDEDGRYQFNMNRQSEIQSAIMEVSQIWQS